MRQSYIAHPTFALGEIRYTVDDSVAAGRTVTDAESLASAGFRHHHVCGPNTTAFDLARNAVEPIAEHLGDIDAIVYATCIPANGNIATPAQYDSTRDVKYLMDYPGSRLQAHFRLDRAQVIGLNQQACTSALGSMRIARALIATEPDISRVLCITSDRFPDGAIYEQAYNLISDGAGAVIVSDQPEGLRLLAAHQITNGAMVIASDDETVGSYFSYTQKLVGETLAKADLSPKDIDWIVPQNTNASAWRILSRILGFSEDRVWFPTLPEAAHIISSDNIVNLHSLLKSGQLRPGERVLMLMAGYGMNWQCVIAEAV